MTGLLLLDARETVVLTGEEPHQGWLRRYLPHPGAAPRPVLLTLAFALITRGERAGQGTIEARLDGQRVGELTHRMADRYKPLLREVMRQSGRPGCRGRLVVGRRGLVEVELRLPAVDEPAGAGPPLPRRRLGAGPHGQVGIGVAAVTAVLLIVGLSVGGARSADPAPPGSSAAASTASAVPWTGPAAATPTPTVVAGPAVPAEPSPSSASAATRGQPRTGAREPSAPIAKTTAARRTAAGTGECHPNYGGCVPIASDVDCEGGNGNGPKFVRGPIQVVGADSYDLDRDDDGVACEPEPETETRSATTSTTTTRTTTPRTTADEEETGSDCDPNYGGCVPVASDVDCEGGSGNGPKFVSGPVRVTGSDVYDLDRDGNGIACD